MNEVINDCVTALNGAGRTFCDYAAGVLLQSALLVVVLLLADLLLRKRVRAVVRYCVWLLVLVKLILPPTLAFPTGIGYWLGDRLSTAFPVADRGAQLTALESARRSPSPGSPLPRETRQVEPPRTPEADASTAPAAGMTPLTWQGILFLLWLVGVLVFVALLLQRLRFVRGLIAFSLPADERFQHIVAECARQVGIRREIGLRVSGTMSSPALCGLFKPVVLVPARILETLSPEGLKAIFIHELAHLKRGDVWVNTLQTVLQVLHFYNPFVWLANAMIRRTREEAVDETVLVALGGQAEGYSNTLIDIGEVVLWKADLGLRLIGVAESEKILRWRIKHMLTRPVPKSARIGVLGTVVLVITAAVLLPMAKAERSNKDAPLAPQTTNVDAAPKAPVTAESYTFVDPQNGIRFTKFKTISGPSDVIKDRFSLNLAPNGKFLLSGVCVVPLDGSTPFDLVNVPYAVGGSWSPDGRKVVFFDLRGLWSIEVAPETGRPMGPARRLTEGEYVAVGGVRWSSDSKRIVFAQSDSDRQVRGKMYTLSIESGELSQVTDPFSFGIVSPDGKVVACDEGQGVRSPNSVLAKPVAGGEARKITGGVYPVVWSADGEWLVCKRMGRLTWEDEIHFIRLADGREAKIRTPGRLIRQSPQGGKLLFYHGSFDYQNVLKVVSAAGGPPAQLGSPTMLLRSVNFIPRYQLWTRDSQSILVEGKHEGGDQGLGLWAVPLDGKDPRPLTIDTPLCRRAASRVFSPDGSKLLLEVWGEDGCDLWVVPISFARMESTGPAVKVFGGIVPASGVGNVYLNAWSPDGKKIAFSHKGDIWVVSADGENPLQLTKTAQTSWVLFSDWSPDGSMIAFRTGPRNRALVHVVPASGGEARVIADLPLGPGYLFWSEVSTWSPDGKELTIASEGVISNFPISGGDGRVVLRARDAGIDNVNQPRWSPDGRLLAFQGIEGRNQKLCVYHLDSATLERLSDDYAAPCYWSPDSKWISFFATETVKTRPQGILWEMDVEEAIAKLGK